MIDTSPVIGFLSKSALTGAVSVNSSASQGASRKVITANTRR